MGKKHKPASNVVVGGEGVHSAGLPGGSKKVMLLGVAVFVVLALGLGGWYAAKKHTDNATRKAANPAVFTSVDQAYQSDAAKLDAELAKAKTADQKSAVLVKRANAALGANKFAEAESWAKQAVAEKPTIEAYSVLGLAASQAHDKQAAVDAYKKAAELTRQQGGEDAEQRAIRLDAAAAQVQ